MIRVSRMVTAATVVLALAVGSAEPAHASPGALPAGPSAGTRPPAPDGPGGSGLPAGWQLTGAGAGKQLVWVAAEPVPMGDARVEFHTGQRLIGRPVADEDRRTFRLRLDGASPGEPDELRVMAGGRRLDGPGAASAPDARLPAAPVKPAAPLPVNQVDPGVPGKYRTVSGEYTLDAVRLPGYPAPVEMRGVVVAPAGAPGPRPLALFLHGRHYTCFSARGNEGSAWPCEKGTRPVPSHRGYLHDQKLLASQGHVTVSIAANGINAQDEGAEDGGAQARSSLVRLHLARWAEWAADPAGAPAEVRAAAAAADLSRVLLVGHSRGGEGVNRAALDSRFRPPAAQDGYRGAVRWRIRGTVLVGPTIFGHNPAPDTPSMTILPGCDGDVSDLQGEMYLDNSRGLGSGTALNSAVYMVGANHNFFNSEWTPGQAEAPADDDFWPDDENPDAVCAPGTGTRLTARQQQTAGSTYIAAAARLFVAGDDRVRPLLDGSDRRAPSAGPARVLSHAVGGNRTPALLPGTSVSVTGGRLCEQVTDKPRQACLPSRWDGRSPHFAGWDAYPEPGRHAVAMRWSEAGAPVRVTPARPFSVSGAEALALRVIVPPNTTGTRLDIALTDASGRRATLGRVRADGLPGTGRTASHWAREVRVPLAAAVRAGLNLKQVKAVELIPRTTSGQAWLMDAWGWRPGTPAVRTVDMPRVDVGRLTVKEGNSGVRVHHVPVRVSGRGTGQVRAFASRPRADDTAVSTVTVGERGRAVKAAMRVTGDTRYGYASGQTLYVKAVRGAVVGSHSGGTTVEDDDPLPRITVKPVTDHVTEGGSLTWRVSLSAPTETEFGAAGFAFLPAGDGTELSTLDVDGRWLEENLWEPRNPERPLSELRAHLTPAIPAGELSAEVSVPTVRDRVSEPEESLRMQLMVHGDKPEPQGPVITATVKDAP
ncbi:hypothetical protein [Streptomyces sp. NPDC001889]